MTKRFFFAIAIGQSGCIPDGFYGHFAGSTRKEIAQAIRDAAEFYELPKSIIGEISLERTFRHAKAHGLSSVSLELSTKSMGNTVLNFMGLTKAEYDAAMAEEDML